MDIKTLLSQLTLEEKASLCSGIDSWRTEPIPRLSIPSAVLSDAALTDSAKKSATKTAKKPAQWNLSAFPQGEPWPAPSTVPSFAEWVRLWARNVRPKMSMSF